jgi:hypothetical protein
LRLGQSCKLADDTKWKAAKTRVPRLRSGAEIVLCPISDCVDLLKHG